MRVWDAVTGEQSAAVMADPPVGSVSGVESDGARVVAGGGDGAVRVWDAVTGGSTLDRTGYPVGWGQWRG
ncbi:MAG: WD40 repeat domain-containing protein [Actinomycetales bacterium]|nr:WD40 repeat domain-containing protein [Candidatus Phosphoribacter baldrii]